jgi:DNA invertase Pin-like site-specific DNA recombinase
MQEKRRAIVYTHSATKEPNTNPTKAQRHAAYDFADKGNLDIVRCVDNIGTSGRNHLPTKLRELIIWANENNIQILVIHSSDHLARTIAGMQELIDLLEKTCYSTHSTGRLVLLSASSSKPK